MKRHLRFILLLLLLLTCCLNDVLAVSSRLYTADELSSDLITSLCQDHQGYIWIGTEYGLNKFDGVYFKQYYNDESDERSLSDNIVRRVFTDRDGGVWIISNIGVQRYNRMNDDFETVLFAGSRTATISDIAETRDGNLWLLSAEHGIFEVGSDLIAHPLASINKLIDRDAKAENMYIDSRSRLWIAYRDTGLQFIDIKKGKSSNYEDLLQPDNHAMDIAEDAKHHLLLLTYTAVFQLNEHSMNFEPVVSYHRNDVHRFYHDAKGQLLIGTTGSGLWLADLAHREVRPVSGMEADAPQLNTSKVHALLQDRDGNQWIGCFQRGLLFVSNKQEPFHFLALKHIEHNNGRVLRSISSDSQGFCYVCQEGGGVTCIDHAGKTRGHWMNNHTIMTMTEEQAGTFLVGTYRNGLFRLNTTTNREEQLTQNQRVTSIVKDLQGNIYTAVFNDGLHSYTPDGRTERTLGKGKLKLNNPYLNKLYTDRDGLIWIGHYYGIDVYDPATDKLADVHVPAALRPAVVYAIGQSPKDHSLWIGSNKGLFQYATTGDHKGQWQRFTTKDGLPNDIVCGLVFTAEGDIWASTYRGLAQRTPDGTFIRYYRGNGLEEWSYLRGVYSYAPTGEVILGNQTGITYFAPDKIAKDDFKQGITLTGMRLGDDDVNGETLSNDNRVITKPLDEVSEITISYLDNTFSLRFSSMDFRDPQNVHYEFRFANEPEDQWYKTESGRSEILFSHLAVGSHQLLVRAYDNGVYSPVKTIMLRVTPPWWRTWTAYLLYLIIIIGIVLLWWRNYWNRHLAQENENKIKFFVDISHELRSPLTLIKSPLDQLLKTSHDPTETRALRNIERNTNRLLTLTDQILSIRKIEKGQMRLHFAETSLGDFVGDIIHDYDYQVEKRQLTLNFDNQAPGMKVWIDRDHFDKVVTNLLGNAMKYVSDGGEISVILRQSADNRAELTVRDNGPGIDEAQLQKVFMRFYQATSHAAAGQMSYGIGLNLTQKLIALHKGTIGARNRTDGHGAEFTVRLPLGSAHLPQDQLVDSDYFAETIVAKEERPVLATDADSVRKVRTKTNYRIAVVDDEEDIRIFLATELGESYHVQTYTNGRKALEGIVDTVPDLVISDVVMPEMDGIELLKRLKASTTTSHIPVILLTTKTEHAARVEGLEQGADAYVDKPFNLEELEARIAGLITNRRRIKGKFSGVQEQEGVVKPIELKGNDAQLMERIMKVINEQLTDEDFNVEALADAVGLSRVQLHRRMKEITGLSVGEFIRNLRLQQAAKILEKGDVTISQVTYAIGMANPTHFATAFKKYFGVTPTEYMNKHNEQAK